MTAIHDTSQYLTALNIIARLAPLINDQLALAGGSYQDAYKPPQHPCSRPPCNPTWLDMKMHVDYLLTVACKQVRADTGGLHGRPVPTIQGRAGWLTHHTSHLSAAEWLNSETWWNNHDGDGTIADATILAARQLQDALDPPIKNPPARTTDELTALFGVSPARVRKWRSRGRIAPVGKRGRANLYPVDQVKALLTMTTEV